MVKKKSESFSDSDSESKKLILVAEGLANFGGWLWARDILELEQGCCPFKSGNIFFIKDYAFFLNKQASESERR